MEVLSFNFNEELIEKLKNEKYGKNWPVTYIITNKNEAYIGETIDASTRTNQHLANEVRRKLKKMYIITDDDFNKSVILDLESFLITNMSADGKYMLQNGNSGLHFHDYYNKERYNEKFRSIWEMLKDKKVVKHELDLIKNTDVFKYSPYKELTFDQYFAVKNILETLSDDISKGVKSIFVVSGGAGTGKTILGVYLLKLLMTAQEDDIMYEEESLIDNINTIVKINNVFDRKIKIGFVVPQQSLRSTITKVFRYIKVLSPNMVYSPYQIAQSNEKFDILIVDEAHRLRQRKNIANYGSFDDCNARLGFGKDGTELDWIMKQSKYQILFYDEDQTIKPTDIPREKFVAIYNNLDNNHREVLQTQHRCLKGGNEYVNYVKRIFSNTPPSKKIKFKEYDFKLFDDPNEMIEKIKEKDKEYGLCRNVAGISFLWTKKKKRKNATKEAEKDINLDGKLYSWNTRYSDWINSKNALDEIGCIHTVQGYDLNYAGIILGDELIYSDEKGLDVDRKAYKDSNGKGKTTDEELRQYIFNIYSTVCLRGMLGTYIYARNPKVQNYLRKYIETYEKK